MNSVLKGPFALPFIQSEIKLIDWRSWIEHGEGNIITVRSVKQLEDIKKVYQTPSR